MKNTSKSLKRLLSMVMVLAMILTILPMTASAAGTPTTLYLKPNSNWKADNARFAAYFFGNGEKWVSMTDSDGDGVYEVAVPAGYPNVIFCRMNPSQTANNWNNKWNQTADLTVPTNGNNMYTVKEGTWDKGGGTWSHLAVTYSVTFNGTNVTSNGSATVAEGSTYSATLTPAEGYDLPETVSVTMGGAAAQHTWDAATGVLTVANVTGNLVIAAEGVEQDDGMITLYFRNDWKWNSVNIYFWGSTTDANPSWPGIAMTKDGSALYGTEERDVYRADIPADATGIIFNGYNPNDKTDQQTPDITQFRDGDAFYIYWDNGNMVNKFDYTPAGGGSGENPDPGPGDEPVLTKDYYLVGYINNADYNGQDYKFVDGKLTVKFVNDSYVVVKDGSGDWYLCQSYCTGNSAVLTKGHSEKMFVDAGTEWTFTLVENGDGTLTLSYAKSEAGGEEPKPTEPVTDVTIHFRNTGLWEKVNYYAWTEGNPDVALNGWPGDAVTENAEHKNWYTVELKDLNAPNGIGIIFNDASAQTGDIMITKNGTYWYDSLNGGLLTEAPATWADGTVQTVNYKATLHFANAKNWGSVYLYTWTASGNPTGAWPGSALGQDSDGFYSMTVEFKAPEGQDLNFIFSGSGQTVDLKLDGSMFELVDGVYTAEKWVVPTTADSEGKFYADILEAAEAIAISPVVSGQTVTFAYKNADASSVQVYGTMNGWASGYTMTKNEYGVWSVTLEDVPYGIQQYKFVVDGSWMADPLNGWTVGNDGNSAFLISNPEADINTIQINVHYNAPSAQWNVCAWGADGLEPQYNFANGVATITLDGRANQYVAFKVRKSTEENAWAEQSGEIRVDLSGITSGTIDVWVDASFKASQALNGDVVQTSKVSSVELDYNKNTITIITNKAVKDANAAFALFKNGEDAGIIASIDANGSVYTLNLKETMSLVTLYQYKVRFLEQIEAYKEYNYDIGFYSAYASDKFAEEFTYEGDDLGSNYTNAGTSFVVWAPTAERVCLKLYATGSDAEEGAAALGTYIMEKGANGTWTVLVQGDLKGRYYTYCVTRDGETVEAVDPYARTTGVNGKRGMIIDLGSTNPENWDQDTNPNPSTSYTDAIIYELHVRDFSIDDSSGVKEDWRGKYLAFTQHGTTTAGGSITGIDYLDALGITHLHLLPVYDYGSVDETKCENFNWGYDPVNYNTPEGSYSTNPYDGAVRVGEFKQMIQALHGADISVVMDVVYNHVYDAGAFCFNQIVPGYFSRFNADGSYSNGSGCGNDTASEREMVRKYIVESVLYWHQEYHIDGFRFDLVGLLDETTINEIVETVHACCPDVIFYGEGWTMGTAVEPGNDMATQGNSTGTPGFAYFSDTIRDLVGGSKEWGGTNVNVGFVSGQTGKEEDIANNFMAKPRWSSNPQQIVQYVSCHDNYTLMDKILIATGKSGIDAETIKMNNLAAAIYMTAQGIPFIHAGEEILREKLEEDGGRCENSYNASDYVNKIRWDNLDDATYANNSKYYRGLIEFRKAHEALRLETRELIDQCVRYQWITNEVVMFVIDGKTAGDISDSIVVIFNATKNPVQVALPQGEWKVCVDATQAGTQALATVADGDQVTVAGISAMVLVQGETEPVAKINSTVYGSLQDALNAAQEGDTVTLLASCSDWKKVNVSTTMTIDLNGFEINRTFGGVALDVADGALTLMDSSDAKTGKISGATDGIMVAYDAALVLGEVKVEGRNGHGIDNDGVLTINGAAISATEYGVKHLRGTLTLNSGSITARQYGIAAYADTTVTINGGTVNGTIAGLSGEGGSHGTTFNVNGGEITSEGVGIYHPQNGSLNISGGTITGATGINVKSGTVTITGGTINGTGAKSDYSFTGGGFTPTGDATVIESCGYPGGAPEVRIVGGTFTSAHADAVASYVGNGVTEMVSGFISGGNFSSDVSALCAEGYGPVKNEDGTYTVHEHSYTPSVTAPTCTEAGYITYTCECGHSYVKPGKPAFGHSYESVVTEPTCGADGYTTYTCSVCGDSYVADEVPATGEHTFGVWKTLKAAGCTSKGLRTRECVCGATQTEVTPATGIHTYGAWTETKAPTCTAAGEKTRTCGCGDTQTAVISALGHTEVIDEAVAATCTAAGKTEGRHCANCSEVLTAQEEIPALGHMEVVDAGKPATHTAEGLTEGKHCAVCNEVLIAQETIPAIGHSFGEWKVVKEATSGAGGEERRSCSCGETESRAIATLPASGASTVLIVVIVVVALGTAAAVLFVFKRKRA